MSWLRRRPWLLVIAALAAVLLVQALYVGLAFAHPDPVLQGYEHR